MSAAMAEPDEQLFLLEDAAIAKIDRSEPPFESTGERFERDHPDLCDLAVEMMAERVPIREISRRLHTTQNTLRAIAMRKRIPIDAARQVIIDGAMFAQRLAVERMTERLQAETAPSLKDSAVAFGILTQNVQLLTGGATVRLERMDSAEDIYSGFERLHARLVESIQNGLAAENPRANALQGEMAGGSLAGPVIDAESEALPVVAVPDATDSATDSAEIEAESGGDNGGEGVASAPGRGVKRTGEPAQDFMPKGGPAS